MEADWEFEVGPDATGMEAPVIDAGWAGFADLRRSPELAWQLIEAVQLPALAETLVRLNGANSPVWSCKCDFWPCLEIGEFDPDELDAPPGCSAHAMGCSIDLLPAKEGQWSLPELIEKVCKRWCGLLRVVPLRSSRVDLVVRRAFQSPGQSELGIAAYLTACGASETEARLVLAKALAAFTDAHSSQAKVE